MTGNKDVYHYDWLVPVLINYVIKLILGNKEQGKKKNWVKNILMEETKFSYSFSLKKKVSYSM